MATTLIVAKNPDDNTATYANILVERAPDSSGSPGAFSQITSKAIDSTNETTLYTDTAGATTDWYRYRYQTSSLIVYSDYSANIQAGQYLVRSWLQTDIPDADLTTTMWDQWRDQVLLDMQGKSLGRPVYPPQSFVPTGVNDEWHGINADIRRVIRVELYDASGSFLTETAQFMQWGRQLRIFFPDPTITYKIMGIGEIRNLGDIDDELFNVLYWGIRVKYIDKRLADRANFKQFLVADKVSDINESQLMQMRQVAEQMYDMRIMEIRNNYYMSVTPASR